MNALHSILFFLSGLTFVYLSVNAVYLLVNAVGGRLIPTMTFPVHRDKKMIAVLIPCYKEDLVILDSVMHLKEHNYPKDRFSITVIADKLQSATISKLRQIPVGVIEVDLSMKSRSLNAGLEAIRESGADIIMILDADNILGFDCLEKINAAFHAGCKAVQCHRTAKNRNTSVAWLDAMSEEININLFRRGPDRLGLSAAPIGSGMAFDPDLITEIFSSAEIQQNPGEDREIDLQLMRRKIKMHFIDDALVYDEKVSNAGVFERQRVRWLEAQLNHVKRFFHGDMISAPKTFLYFNKILQILLLPRILTVAAFGIFLILLVAQSAFGSHLLFPSAVAWIVLMIVYLFSLIISIPADYFQLKTLLAFGQVPLLMLAMVRALMQMKRKRTEFLHTPKSFNAES